MGQSELTTRRRFLSVLGLGSVAGLATACDAGSSATTSSAATESTASPAAGSTASPTAGSTAQPSGSTHGLRLDVTEFGARGDGQADDSDAIDRALEALRPGGSLTFPAGRTFRHSRVIVVDTPNTSILGPGKLLATAEATSAVQIDADGVTVRGLSLGITGTSQRWSTPAQHKLFLGAHTNVSVRDVIIDGSAAAGLFCYGTSQSTLRNVHVSGTRADGIHMTNGCHDLTVEAPCTSATGDDGIAVVSYSGDGAPCRNITVDNAEVRSTTGGRGMSVVGGENVTYRNLHIDKTNAAGLYIACENGDFVSYPVQHVTVNGGTIDGTNTNAAIDHGGVLVYSGRSDGGVTDVSIADLRVTNTRASASRQIGVVVTGDAPVADVSFAQITLDPDPEPYEGNAPVQDVTMRQVRADGENVVASVTP